MEVNPMNPHGLYSVVSAWLQITMTHVPEDTKLDALKPVFAEIIELIDTISHDSGKPTDVYA